MLRSTSALGLALIVFAACGDDGNTNPPTPDAPDVPGPQTIRLNDDITADTTFKAENTYVIPRLKQLFVRDGATLTIEPGTTIQGEQGSVITVARGSKINATGTPDKPITFTSAQPVGSKTPGFWGGLIVLGAAPINNNVLSTPASAEATFEAFTSAIPEGKFGGTNAADNSGVLKYVRIEFGGFNFVADREFNGLTLCGVGSGTEIDFVQVHKGQDDGIELFGGTVNVKHLVLSQNEDDGFDTDNGWQGKGQFVIIQNVSHPATLPEASNGYESDNHATAASFRADPRTSPTMYNVTLVGDHAYTGQKSFAAVFRRGTGGHYFNHIWINFPQGPEFRDVETLEQLNSGALEIRSSMFFGNDATATNLPPPQATGDIDESLFLDGARGVQFNVDPGLSMAGIMDKAKPDFKPINGAASLTGGATPPNDGFFDTSATFIGAIGAEDWTTGWTTYPQN